MKPIGEGIEKLKTDFINSPMGLTTGFSEFDYAIHGLLPGHLIVIGARSGCGKTSLLADIALAAGQDDLVSIFSLEMTRLRMQARLACALSGINFGRARAGKLTDIEMERFSEALGKLKKYKINIDDEACIVGMDEYWLQTMKVDIDKTIDSILIKEVKKGSKLILIDYLQLISPLRPTQDKSICGEIAKSLRDYAKRYNVCVVLFSQLRKFDQSRYDKDGKMPEPTLDDLKYSGDIEIHSDVITLLHRPQQGKGNSPLFSECIENDAKFLLLKNRDGATLEIGVDFHASSMSWRPKDYDGGNI